MTILSPCTVTMTERCVRVKATSSSIGTQSCIFTHLSEPGSLLCVDFTTGIALRDLHLRIPRADSGEDADSIKWEARVACLPFNRLPQSAICVVHLLHFDAWRLEGGASCPQCSPT